MQGLVNIVNHMLNCRGYVNVTRGRGFVSGREFRHGDIDGSRHTPHVRWNGLGIEDFHSEILLTGEVC